MCLGKVIGKLFGVSSAPKIIPTPPPPPPATAAGAGLPDGSADSEAARQERRRRGFASTQVSSDRSTILGSAAGRKTLG